MYRRAQYPSRAMESPSRFESQVQKQPNAAREKGFNFDDARLMRGGWRNEPNPECSASPDESALVTAAKNFGFFFYRRTPTMIFVRESHLEKMGKVQDVSYEILNVLEFNREHLEQFGASGLRTLCLAYKNLNSDVYENWNEKYIQAKSALRDKEKKLDEVSELIGKDLILIGCTAIEDKLQEGVPACIETLARAGINKYEQSLSVLKHAKLSKEGMITKTSIMLGLGETDDELKEAMADLWAIGVDILI
ncbi:hypothetical protein ACS0TY_026298 [Phlomoides rotata]